MVLHGRSEANPAIKAGAAAERPAGRTECPLRGKAGWFSRMVLGLSLNSLLAILGVVILLAEACNVALHFLVPQRSIAFELVMETSVLLVMLLPAYFCLYRPAWLERQRSEEDIRRLSRQLIRAEESTRKALARDLHDEFGQLLSALQFGVETLCQTLPADTTDKDKLLAHCSRLSGMIARLGSHVRDVTAELRPSMLDNAGLIAALRWHARQFERQQAGVRVDIRSSHGESRLSPEVEIALYRVCQESLNNVAKHARARQVRIALQRTRTLLTLAVEDDGIGFEAECWRNAAASHNGFGILGMRERIADLGGSLEVVSRPGKGTTVRVRLPLARGEEGR